MGIGDWGLLNNSIKFYYNMSITKYDPMKEINNNKYLNFVFLKSRYQLMNLNVKNKYNIKNHWLKNIPPPFMDIDLIYNF